MNMYRKARDLTSPALRDYWEKSQRPSRHPQALCHDLSTRSKCQCSSPPVLLIPLWIYHRRVSFRLDSLIESIIPWYRSRLSTNSLMTSSITWFFAVLIYTISNQFVLDKSRTIVVMDLIHLIEN